jgi:hypothetical protein
MPEPWDDEAAFIAENDGDLESARALEMKMAPSLSG